MDIYLVGGAVRDEMLNLPVTERDWVVVGASAQDMLDLGYQSVGKSFPVFLHPVTREEYALARVERKVSAGHQGFSFDTSNVTLEQDLQRRDLTINAIARDSAGKIIDPTGGLSDLEHGILRHISAAFAEDPLRVLRVARLAAKFTPLGFTIAPETLQLMQGITERGELNELSNERIFAELVKALATDAPMVFFETLNQIGAGQLFWPAVNEAQIRDLQQILPATIEPMERFAALVISLDRQTIMQLCAALRTPAAWRDLAILACVHRARWREISDSGADAVVELLYEVDAFRQPDRFSQASQLLAHMDAAQETHQRWQKALQLCQQVSAQDIASGITGPALGQAIRDERISRIRQSGL